MYLVFDCTLCKFMILKEAYPRYYSSLCLVFNAPCVKYLKNQKFYIDNPFGEDCVRGDFL